MHSHSSGVVFALAVRQRDCRKAPAAIALLYAFAILAGSSQHNCLSNGPHPKPCRHAASTHHMPAGGCGQEAPGKAALGEFAGGFPASGPCCPACLHELACKVPPPGTCHLTVPSANKTAAALSHPAPADRMEWLSSTSPRAPPAGTSTIAAAA
jgi:hypothetical protein